MVKGSNFNKFFGCLVAVLIITFFSGAPKALALWVGENIDVHNNTNQVAHDFHIEGTIKSVTPPTLGGQIGYVNSTPFPTFNHSITSLGGDMWQFSANWSGLDVPSSSVGHFGLFYDVWSRNVMIDKTGWWTDGNGNKIGNGWPVFGFEVPTNWWDPPQSQVFKLQAPPTIPVEILQMDLTGIPLPPASSVDSFFDIFTELNVNGMNNAGFQWRPIIHSQTNGLQLQPASFFDVFTLAPLGPMQPDELVIARVFAKWEDEPAGRWFFEVHQEHPVPEPATMFLLSIGLLGIAFGFRKKSKN